MLNYLRQLLTKQTPQAMDEADDFITELAASDIWIVAIGLRGTPVTPSVTDAASFSAAIKVLVPYRKPLSELGEDDSVFPFNFKRDGRQTMPFFSSEEKAYGYLADTGFASNISAIFQPFSVLAGFVAAPQNDKFDLVLDICSPGKRRIEDEERLRLRSLSTAS